MVFTFFFFKWKAHWIHWHGTADFRWNESKTIVVGVFLGGGTFAKFKSEELDGPKSLHCWKFSNSTWHSLLFDLYAQSMGLRSDLLPDCSRAYITKGPSVRPTCSSCSEGGAVENGMWRCVWPTQRGQEWNEVQLSVPGCHSCGANGVRLTERRASSTKI